MDRCEQRLYYEYDDLYDCYTCSMDLDQDEMELFLRGRMQHCPFFQPGDEYQIVRKQM